MIKTVFHKGDFYSQKEHDGKGWSGPIFQNDGITEHYYHTRNYAIDLLKDGTIQHIKNAPSKIKHEMSNLKRAIKALRDKCGNVTLPGTKIKIKNVTGCSC